MEPTHLMVARPPTAQTHTTHGACGRWVYVEERKGYLFVEEIDKVTCPACREIYWDK